MGRRMRSTRGISVRVLDQLGSRAWSLVGNEVGSMLKQLGRHEEASHGTVQWESLLITGRYNPQGLVDFDLEADVLEHGETAPPVVGPSHLHRLDVLTRENTDQALQLEQAYRTVQELQRRINEVRVPLARAALLGVASAEHAKRAVAVLNAEVVHWGDSLEESPSEKNPRGLS